MRHPKLTIAASGTFPITTEFTEWIAWADGKILSYLQVSALPTDVGDILKNVADDLLVRKYTYEKKLKLHDGGVDLPMPDLTVGNKMDLDSIKGQSDIEDPAFNFDIQRLEGGFD